MNYENKIGMESTLALRIAAETAFRVIASSGNWIRNHRSSLESADATVLAALLAADSEFWTTLDPVFDELLGSDIDCAWCTAGLRLGFGMLAGGSGPPPGFYFLPKGRQDVVWLDGSQAKGERNGWKLAARISEFSRLSRKPPFEILLTSDLCINVLEDGQPLTIVRNEHETKAVQHGWVVDVSHLIKKLDAHYFELESLLARLANSPKDSMAAGMLEIDQLLISIIDDSSLRSINVTSNVRECCPNALNSLTTALLRGGVRGLALSKYLVLMNFVWPDWRRITMVPHLGPSFGHAQPGGLVLCEDQPLERGGLETEEVDIVAAVASAAMWPWLGFQMRDDPIGGFEPLQTIEDKLRKVQNSYSEKEDEFGLAEIELVDIKDSAYLETVAAAKKSEVHVQRNLSRGLAARSVQGVSIVIPVRGRTETLIECLKSIQRQTFWRQHAAKIELLVIQDGQSEKADDVNPVDSEEFWKTLRLIKPAAVRIFELTSNHGRATARNIGIQKASKEVVCFVDSSMILEQDFLIDQLMRHERVEGVALLGFKENITIKDYIARSSEIASGIWSPNFRNDWKYAHLLKEEEAWFIFRGRPYYPGENINFMEATNYLKDLAATEQVGSRSLPTFFQTNIASIKTSRLREVGGFETLLDVGWGYEDSFLGACLAAKGVKLVPTPSSVAFKIEHEESGSKRSEVEFKRMVYAKLIRTTRLQQRSAQLLELSIEELEKSGHLKEHVAKSQNRRRTR